jgi:hypothetical protein
MSARFGVAFGAILALVLLALFAWSTLSWIIQIVAANGAAVAKGTGYVYVLTTVAGLVSALVIAQLSVTKPGTAPGLGGLTPESTIGVYVTNTIVAIYLIVWIVTGLSALIVGVMLYPENNRTISDLGTTWLGLAVSAAYAYFGISPAGSDKNALSAATTSSVSEQLEQKINEGKITFQAPNLKAELLRTNTGTQKVTTKLQALVLELSKISPKPIEISELLRTSGSSHHVAGRAVDIGNEQIAKDLLPLVATDAKVAQLGIDEIIFDAGVAGESDRNKWNYDSGSKHTYDTATLNDHDDHIHFAAVA